jgi:ABC-2 type transport system permease protein
MRLWAEERKAGTIELLMTLPVSTREAVLGKFLAAWLFTGIALALTFPVWLTVNYLGDPDNAVILVSYIGSFLMAGAYLAVGACVSAFTRNQVIAFVLTFVICFVFVLAGFPMVMDLFQGWAPQPLINAINSMSFLSHFESITKGVIDLRDLIFFFSFIGCWLLANAVAVEMKKSD